MNKPDPYPRVTTLHHSPPHFLQAAVGFFHDAELYAGGWGLLVKPGGVLSAESWFASKGAPACVPRMPDISLG